MLCTLAILPHNSHITKLTLCDMLSNVFLHDYRIATCFALSQSYRIIRISQSLRFAFMLSNVFLHDYRIATCFALSQSYRIIRISQSFALLLCSLSGHVLSSCFHLCASTGGSRPSSIVIIKSTVSLLLRHLFCMSVLLPGRLRSGFLPYIL